MSSLPHRDDPDDEQHELAWPDPIESFQRGIDGLLRRSFIDPSAGLEKIAEGMERQQARA